MSPHIVLQNIDHTRRMAKSNQSVNTVALVCGADDQAVLKTLFDRHSSDIFNVDGSTKILVFEERLGSKTRQGNFLGALLAYRRLKEQAAGIQNRVILMGMVFGRGERISPFSQIHGNRKTLIRAASPQIELQVQPLTSIEEAMRHFAPLAAALEQGGFRGILCKWGDETQIPSVPLEKLSFGNFSLSDVIKCVAQIPVTDESASQKDWVVFDGADAKMIAQLSRNSQGVLLKEMGSWTSKYPKAQAGVSLGPVAVSNRVLELALEIFHPEIERGGVVLDFDPFVIQALGFDADETLWNAEVEKSPGLQAVVRLIPDFFARIQELKKKFAARYGRPLIVEVLDLGADLYWADVGQHRAFAEKVFAVNEQSPRGEIARELEEIFGSRDARGNLIIDSVIAPSVDVFNSVIIHSVISGSGIIAGSVIKNSLLHDVKINKGFVLHSARVSVTMEENSGLYEALGTSAVTVKTNERLGTLLTEEGPKDLRVCETTDLRKRGENYDRPIFDNALSFERAFVIMQTIPAQTLQQRRRRARADVIEGVVERLFALFQSGVLTEERLNLALTIIHHQ